MSNDQCKRTLACVAPQAALARLPLSFVFQVLSFGGVLTTGAGLALPTPVAAQTAAEDDAAFAARVFAEQILKSEDLAQRGVISEADVDLLRLRLTDAKIQSALARGNHNAMARLLKERVRLTDEQLAKTKRLVDRGVLSQGDYALVEHGHRDSLISLARQVGDRQEVVRQLERQIAIAEQQIEQTKQLTQRRIVPQAELALNRLQLAALKNRLDAAERRLVDETPGNAI